MKTDISGKQTLHPGQAQGDDRAPYQAPALVHLGNVNHVTASTGESTGADGPYS